jgi:exosortase E/protease (VPEID-CTERM system)
MNIVRITALIAIGDAGHEGVALHGFHSDAGWILFNAVAFGFLLAANRLPWLHKNGLAAPRVAQTETRNEAVMYLLPFVAVLAASMVAKAASDGFEWLYPLRLVAALAVFWWFRAEYRKLDWKFGWLGPVAGAAVFAMWFGLARWQHVDGTALGGQLAQLARWQRVGWIAARAVAAVVTVPIAEELAFRGYLARRVMAADVETVPFARLSAAAMLVSSAVFGLMHGKMWVAGIVAGLAFAGVAKVRGRLGEAVAAHATANLLIAVWVLVSGDFGMW